MKNGSRVIISIQFQSMQIISKIHSNNVHVVLTKIRLKPYRKKKQLPT